MTEFEINKSVAEKDGIRHNVNDLVGVVSAERYRGCYYNPCNESYQAIDIMLKNNICIIRNNDNDCYDSYMGLSINENKVEYVSHYSHKKTTRSCNAMFPGD